MTRSVKYLLLLTTIILFEAIALNVTAQEEEKLYETEIYKNRMLEFTQNPLLPGQVVCLGNSLTQGGKWSEYFPLANPGNRGVIGDITEGMLARLDEILKAKPKKIFFLGGINDISQDKSNKEIEANIRLIINRVKKESPETKIYIQSLLPINNTFGRYKKLIGKEKQIKGFNKTLKEMCKKEKVTFINLYPLFLDKSQLMNADYTTDGLHLNSTGYEVWTKQLQPYMNE